MQWSAEEVLTDHFVPWLGDGPREKIHPAPFKSTHAHNKRGEEGALEPQKG